MKKTTLGKLKDGQKFVISLRLKTEYEVVRKEKGGILFSAVISNRTFKRLSKTIVYIL